MKGEDAVLEEFLLAAGLLSRPQLEAARAKAEESGSTLSHAIQESGLLDEDVLHSAWVKSMHMPLVELRADEFQEDVLAMIPEPLCRAHAVVPFKQVQDELHVAALREDALEHVRALRLAPKIRLHYTDRKTIKNGLLRYQQLLRRTHAEAIAAHSRAVAEPLSGAQEDIRYAAERLTVEQLIRALLRHALSQSARAVRLQADTNGLRVYYRIGGSWYEAMQLPAHVSVSTLARLKLMAKLPLSGAQEGRFKVSLDEGEEPLSIRIAVLPAHNAEHLVLHLAPETLRRRNFTLESLGFHGKNLESLHHALTRREGLILVYGGSGSGKTTLLYTLADLLTDPTRSIVSIEEHLEMRLPGVAQLAASPEEGITLSGRMRAALSMEPDVLLVGNCREPQVVASMLHAANRGVLVIAAIEAGSLLDALEKLESAGADMQLLASVLVTSVGVAVRRRLCPRHERTKLSRGDVEMLESAGARLSLVLDALKEEELVDRHAQWKDLQFGKPLECDACERGYAGLIGLNEVFPATLSLRRAIAESDEEGVAFSVGEARVLTLLEDAVAKAAQGDTSIEEIFSVV